MAMDFAKLDFAVSFNPATAFPLDARSYFESLEAAQNAASAAVPAGSSDGVYYFGQTISVVENEVASFYIIQPDKTLKPVAGADDKPVKVLINEKHFKYTEDNKLELLGAAEATEGQVLAMDATGNLAWVTPVDAYTKTETDDEISKAVAAAAHLKRKKVDSIDDIDKDTAGADQYIYMVPNGLTLEDDRYDEYMVINVDGTNFIEKVGTWAVDLNDYAKKTELDNYVQKNGTDRLITEAEANKIAESEKNVIASVSSDFSVSETRELSLNNIAISKVTDLQTELNKKVNAQEGYKLLSPNDQAKLEKLVVGEDGQVGISGTINASNVEELDQWVEDNRNTIDGLISTADQTKLDNLFDQVNSDEFEIATINIDDGQKKQLNLVAVPITKVTGMPFTSVSSDFVITEGKELTLAKDYVSKSEVGNLDELIHATGNESSSLVEEINFINERLTWQNIDE